MALIYVAINDQWHWLLVTLVSWFFIGMVGSSITLHRLLSHRSFRTYPWLEKFLTFISVYTTMGSTLSWAALHRFHHKNADENHDPHTPNIDKKFNLKQGLKIWFGYGWTTSSVDIRTLCKDLIDDPLHCWIHLNYFKIIIVTSIILILIDPYLWVFVYAIPACMVQHVAGITNVLGHSHGYRNFETNDLSTNSWICNLFTLGEGWHNNHHADPSKYYLGHKWWEWDLMGRVIQLIRIN